MACATKAVPWLGKSPIQLQGLELLVWVDYLSKFSLSGSLECHPVGAMSESMLRVFNLSVARWYALSSYSASGIAHRC